MTFTGHEKSQFMYIAFTYPFSYEDCNQYLDGVQDKIAKSFNEQIYFHRELLVHSLEERHVELITISGHNGKKEELEDTLDGLFPDFDQSDEKLKKRFSTFRPHKFDKKCVFLSARVHPGEVQSSFVLNGIIDFLLSKYYLDQSFYL